MKFSRRGIFFVERIFLYYKNFQLCRNVEWIRTVSTYILVTLILQCYICCIIFYSHREISMWEAFWLWNTFFKIKELFRFSVSSCINFCHLCVSRCLFLLVSCQVYWHRCFLIYSNYLFNVCTCTLCHSVISNSLPVQGVISNSCQAPLCMGFFRQEYWSGLPLPSPGDLFDPGIEPTLPVSPVLAGRFFTTEPSFNS